MVAPYWGLRIEKFKKVERKQLFSDDRLAESLKMEYF
jgi:hypothetical protein